MVCAAPRACCAGLPLHPGDVARCAREWVLYLCRAASAALAASITASCREPRRARAHALTPAARAPHARAAESSGEQWSAVQNVQSVLLSIQSLMHDKPYHNEPNFEADDGSGDIERYNDKIAHETLRVAVVEVMEDTLDARPTPNGAVASFADLRKQLFLMQHDNYVKTLERWAASAASHVRDGRQFKMMPFECSTNGMRGSFAWRNVGERLRALRKRVDEEMDGWRQIGVEQAALARSGSAIGLSPAVSTVREQLAKLHADPPELCFLGPGEENALVWEVSLLGPEGTSFEGGCFQLEILFPPNYPDSCARRAPCAPAPIRRRLRVRTAAHPRRLAPARPRFNPPPRARRAQLAANPLHDEHISPEHLARGRAVPAHAAAVARGRAAATQRQTAARGGARAAAAQARPGADHAPERGRGRAVLLDGRGVA